MTRAVVWDIGNVIVRWNPRTLYDRLIPDTEARERFLGEVCTMVWHVAHDLGVTFADNRTDLLERHPEHAELIRAWETGWWEMFSGAIPETEAAIEALASRGVPQYGLSNISHEVLEGVMGLSPAFRHLRGVVTSGELKIIKPDPRIYAHACERFGLIPAETLFIDDSAHNIEAARNLGFDVHHFTDPKALGPALDARGLI